MSCERLLEAHDFFFPKDLTFLMKILYFKLLFFVHKLKQTYIDFTFYVCESKNIETIIKITKKNRFGHFGHVMGSKYSALT